MIALAGNLTGDTTLMAIALVAQLVALAAAVAELRQASNTPRRHSRPRRRRSPARRGHPGTLHHLVLGPAQSQRTTRATSAGQAASAATSRQM